MHPMPRRGPAQGQGQVQDQVLESTATSLAPTPPPQMTAYERATQRQMIFNRLRSQQILIAQRVRDKFAPPTPSTVRIQQQFALLQQQARQRNRRLSLQFAERNNAGYVPVLTAEARREQLAALNSQSREMEYRMRTHFGESWQQRLARPEQINSVIHARELRHRLSVLDLTNYTPRCMAGRPEASSAPCSPPAGSSGAHGSSRQPLLNGEREPCSCTRSESSSPVKIDKGRTPAPVIANGRTLEQRLRDPLPDVGEWHPALNGNPAGRRPRSLTESAASPGECLQPLACDGTDDAFSVLRCPMEGEAGPSTWARSGSQTERDDASSSTMYEAQPADLPLPASSDEGDGSANERVSAPRTAPSSMVDDARPENCPLPESSDVDSYVPLVRYGSKPPDPPSPFSSEEECPGPFTLQSPRMNEAGTRDRAQPGCNDRESSASPIAQSPKDGEAGPAGPSDRFQPRRSQPRRTSHSPREGEAGPSRRSRPRTREAEPTPSLPAPCNPFYGGGVTPHRDNFGPLRIITPVAAYVPGDTDLPVPPPRTAQRARRVDEHERIVDLGSSDREGSDRVIASSSSESSVGDENRDADDEDSGSDPVVVAKEEK
jgi:hypothetical protein